MRKSLIIKNKPVQKAFWGMIAQKGAGMLASKGAGAAASQGGGAAAGGTADAGGDMMGMAKDIPQPPWNMAKPLGQGIAKGVGANEAEAETAGEATDFVAGGARASTDPVGGAIQMAKAAYALNSSKGKQETAYGEFEYDKKFMEDKEIGVGLATGMLPLQMMSRAFGKNKKNERRKKEMENKIKRARFSALDSQKQDDYNMYSSMGQNAMLAMKSGGSLLPKKLYRSDRTFNGDDYSRVWTKRPGTILAKNGFKVTTAQGGMRLQDIYVDQKPALNDGNSFEQINISGGQERSIMPMLQGRLQQKALPTRRMRSNEGQEVDPDNAQKFEKGGKAKADCGCDPLKDGIDTDLFKDFSEGIIGKMRRTLGMGSGKYTDKMKRALKDSADKSGMTLAAYVESMGPEVSGELKAVKARQGAVLKKKSPPLFQQGGILAKENKILDGTFHSRRNQVAKNLEGAEITKKGIPVISEECDDDGCEIVQHAEVEKNELVFSKENTQVVEQYIQKVEEVGEDQSRELYIELGQWLQLQLLENTEDSKDKLLK